jgi:hypothetical protein
LTLVRSGLDKAQARAYVRGQKKRTDKHGALEVFPAETRVAATRSSLAMPLVGKN